MYCLRCRKKTSTDGITESQTTNKRWIKKGVCTLCYGKKCQFIVPPVDGGNIDIHSIIGKMPRPKKGFVLSNHKYTGPYNPLHEQLDENDNPLPGQEPFNQVDENDNPLPGQEPFNQVDEISRQHDICYRDHSNDKTNCDKVILNKLNQMTSNTKREFVDKTNCDKVMLNKLRQMTSNTKREFE